MNIDIGEIHNLNDYDELARMFFYKGEYSFSFTIIDQPEGPDKKDEIKRHVYNTLTKHTGKTLPWGILTGVKPVKLFAQIADKDGIAVAESLFENRYLVSQEKTNLTKGIYELQKEILPQPDNNLVAIYVGIPFCPTKCAYCTFTSYVGCNEDRLKYLEALSKEIVFVGDALKSTGKIAESIYIGGGTPTALDSIELEQLLSMINRMIPKSDATEFCVEAGRPDTIDLEKTKIMKDCGVKRISINPQTLNENTLKLIGRAHSNREVESAFNYANNAGIESINADLIAGLPQETIDDFSETLDCIVKYNPTSITVHTLALKKGSAIQQETPNYNYKQSGIAADMLNYAQRQLNAINMSPYYMYRQKQMVDNLENIGYSKQGMECIYNMRIMQEKQTVIALGAGGSSKLFFPDIDRVERIFNVAEYKLYIDRIDEMIERKKRMFIYAD